MSAPAASTAGGGPQAGVGARHRRHTFPGRDRAVLLRLTGEEHGDLAAAAARSGLTLAGYAAEAALAAARGSRPPAAEPWREVLVEVMAARAQVRRFGSNVNQAVRGLNASGEAPEWLDRAVSLTARAVEQLDVAAAELVRRLR